MSIIGTCSLCGGPVSSPVIRKKGRIPVPFCTECGSTKKGAFGPIIEMEKLTNKKPANGFPFSDLEEPLPVWWERVRALAEGVVHDGIKT